MFSITSLFVAQSASQISGNSADGEDMLFMMEDDDIVPTTRPKCDSLCTGAAGGAASGAGTVSLSSTHSQSQHSVKGGVYIIGIFSITKLIFVQFVFV